MTVTYLSPFRVCRQTCSSTPTVVTPSSRSALSTSSAPAARIASEAVFHATPRLAATRAIDIRIDQDRLDRQHDRLTRQLPLRRRRRRDAVTPDPSTRPAPVARNHHLPDRRFPSERHMRQPAQHRIVSDPGLAQPGHGGGGVVGRQRSTVWSGSTRWAVTDSPRRSRRQNVSRQGGVAFRTRALGFSDVA